MQCQTMFSAFRFRDAVSFNGRDLFGGHIVRELVDESGVAIGPYHFSESSDLASAVGHSNGAEVV